MMDGKKNIAANSDIDQALVGEISYREALAEIESIVKKIEDPKVKIEEITSDVKRALLLIRYCKEELRGYREESNKLFE